MSTAIIAKTSPYILELEPGTYWWCRCGRSQNQPFCDGTHKETDITPLKLELSEKQSVTLCGCKRSSNPPYCDGTHNSLEE